MSDSPSAGEVAGSANAPQVSTRQRTRFMVLGIALLIVGVAAFTYSFIATVFAVEVCGAMLILAGAMHASQSVSELSWRQFSAHALLGVIAAGVGVMTVF